MSFRGFARQLLGLGPASRARLREGQRLLKQPDVSSEDVRRRLPDLLASNNWEVRNVAIKLIAKIRDESRFGLLLEKLSDPDEAGIVRRNAAELLGRWGRNSPEVEGALCAALDDRYWEVRGEAARALAALAPPGGRIERELVKRIFGNGGPGDAVGSNGSVQVVEKNFEVRANVAQALGSVGGSPAAFAALEALAADAEWIVRFQAAVALAELASRLPEYHEQALRTMIHVDHLCSGALPMFVFPSRMGRLIEEMHGGAGSLKAGVLRDRYIRLKQGWHRADEKLG